MWARVENGELKYTIEALPETWENVSYPAGLPVESLIAMGWFPVVDAPVEPVPENMEFDAFSYEVQSGSVLRVSRFREKAPISERTPEQIAAGIAEQLERALDNFINNKFSEKGYDSRITVAMRTGYAGPWQAECITMSLWMDACYVYAYQVMENVKSGLRGIPTEEELIAELPEFPL